MLKIIFIMTLLVIQVTYAEGQLWLSPVNTGDCVADRIRAKKDRFVVEYDRKYCARNLPDKAKERICLENTGLQRDFSFFTDRCSEREFFIGINGEEVQLKRISKKPGKPHFFIGSFAGKGFNVDIRPRRLKQTYIRDRSENEVEGGVFDVLVTIRKGARKKTYNAVLSYGL